MQASAVGWDVPVGDQITASIADPPGGLPAGLKLGARVEVPVTRAIVSSYQRATLSAAVWTVTLDGVLEPGGYQFVWRTDDAEPPYVEVWIPLDIVGSSAASATGDDIFPGIDRAGVTPSSDDVAELERARIVGPGGVDPGTFTSSTRPTQTEVEGLIEVAIDDTLAQLPYAADPRHYETIRNAVTVYAAVLIETSYFREQSDEGAVEIYRSTFNTLLDSINARITDDYNSAAMAEVGTGSILA